MKGNECIPCKRIAKKTTKSCIAYILLKRTNGECVTVTKFPKRRATEIFKWMCECVT